LIDGIASVLVAGMLVVIDRREMRDGWESGDDALAIASGVELVGRKFAIDLDGF
jgi:hypothetical protein